MSRWRAESALARRYLGVGAVNTLVGFAVIFLLTWLGTSPWIANAAGYAVGLAVGFVLSRTLVFAAQRGIAVEGSRYVLAFALAFLANLAVLHLSLDLFGLTRYASQLVAAATYTLAMFLLCRHVVFANFPGPRR